MVNTISLPVDIWRRYNQLCCFVGLEVNLSTHSLCFVTEDNEGYFTFFGKTHAMGPPVKWELCGRSFLSSRLTFNSFI